MFPKAPAQVPLSLLIATIGLIFAVLCQLFFAKDRSYASSVIIRIRQC